MIHVFFLIQPTQCSTTCLAKFLFRKGIKSIFLILHVVVVVVVVVVIIMIIITTIILEHANYS
jgi:hypothetical protein